MSKRWRAIMTDIDASQHRAILTDRDLLHGITAKVQNQVPNKDTGTHWWPVLGISFALMCTVTWCSFLVWLVSGL
jgi:hypothetical protein